MSRIVAARRSTTPSLGLAAALPAGQGALWPSCSPLGWPEREAIAVVLFRSVFGAGLLEGQRAAVEESGAKQDG